ncbi:MAG: hypothetical protein IAF94_18910 [Pirellulaceae bacterium]|nr:hypothetical protein [Pirellulaceae bacterium]
MQSDVLSSIVRNLTHMGPMIVLCVLGIIFALVQREKAPKAATFVIVSLVVLLLLVIIRPIGYYAINLIEGEVKFSLISLWSFLCSVVDMASTAGLIFAVFCDRAVPMGSNDPFAKPAGGVPAYPGPSFPGPAPLPPLGGPMRPQP